ncbi:rhamnogalacturonate lyase B-like isoform X1 [Actinidia eriantha]|uniref:rhamnogalacturonate lyase B-like isoform X1 n=1 Tax=Actinidia eriantha TaxID=165200 RepID=UPI002585626D|nr:rhamnogalacturonate lyase B-like isoform X1 [Actinidia eriantha]
MEKKQWGLLMVLLVKLFLLAESSGRPVRSPGSINKQEVESLPPLRLHILDDDHVVMDNGLVQVTLSTPEGMVTRIQYHGIDNILEYNKEDNRGYWDIIWTSGQRVLDHLKGTSFRVIAKDENQIEISFPSTWNPKINGRPLNVDKRFIMLRGSSGFYTYSIFERLKGWPAMSIDLARVAFKLQNKLFKYMAISDTRQRIMPTPNDRSTGQPLDYHEAVLLTNPSNQSHKGEVDDKYQYSADIKDCRVHGWISLDQAVGFWVITPSNEFRIGGPLKQELTSHVGPTSLSVFFSNHYAGTVALEFEEGEPWKKVFGPIFIYLNSAPSDEDPKSLWKDAKQQMMKETGKWPYNFPLSKDFPSADQRGTVSGRLLVRDKYMKKDLISGSSAYVGLALPGAVRSWQTENKGYQFWTEADANGYFVIKDIRPGSYNLYAWVPGVIGDYRYDVSINVSSGNEIKLGNLVYDPPRIGPTLWEIGFADRTAAEFYVPDPDPDRINNLYIDHPEKFRQYGLWNRYSDLYPDRDLIYTVGKSTYQRDWFFAHVTRKTVNDTYVPTTWTILFDLDYVRSGTHTLHLALASTSYAALQVRINDPLRTRPHFTTMLVGKDNAIARHGIHGLYSLYSVDIPSFQLLRGRNAIYLTQSRGGGPFNGLMYDYLRLEGPSEII